MGGVKGDGCTCLSAQRPWHHARLRQQVGTYPPSARNSHKLAQPLLVGVTGAHGGAHQEAAVGGEGGSPCAWLQKGWLGGGMEKHPRRRGCAPGLVTLR